VKYSGICSFNSAKKTSLVNILHDGVNYNNEKWKQDGGHCIHPISSKPGMLDLKERQK
jgi:hypothetical protein